MVGITCSTPVAMRQCIESVCFKFFSHQTEKTIKLYIILFGKNWIGWNSSIVDLIELLKKPAWIRIFFPQFICHSKASAIEKKKIDKASHPLHPNENSVISGEFVSHIYQCGSFSRKKKLSIQWNENKKCSKTQNKKEKFIFTMTFKTCQLTLLCINAFKNC